MFIYLFRTIGFIALLALLSACTTPKTTPTIAPLRSATIDAPTADAIDSRLRAFVADRSLPGLSIAVGRDDDLLWSSSYGAANLATGEPVTDVSIFPLGSTSKPITSLLLGQLVEEGLLDLDAPIQDYVPYFPLKEQLVTSRQLAGHLAGLRDYDQSAGEYHNTRRFASVREAVEVFADDPLLFEPGTQYAYSAYNFVLLSAAIEGATGEDFLTVLSEHLVEPLKLERTGPNFASISDLVTSYTLGFYGRIMPANVGDPSNKWAAGGLVSTPIEMVHIGNALLAGRIVKPETFALLTTPQRLDDGSDTGEGYGLGWRRGERELADGRKVPVVHHGGTSPGSMSFFVIYPTESLVVSVQTNLLFRPFAEFAVQAFHVAESILMVEE